MIKIEYSLNAEKQLTRIRKSDQKIYQLLLNSIETLAKDPYQGKKLTHFKKADYAYRVRQYRILYNFNKKILQIMIIDIRHRKDVYRMLLNF